MTYKLSMCHSCCLYSPKQSSWKNCVAPKKALWKKVKFKVACNDRIMEIFNNKNSGEFVLPSLGFGTKFNWIVIIKLFPLFYISWPFQNTSWGDTLFYSLDFSLQWMTLNSKQVFYPGWLLNKLNSMDYF